MAFCEDLPDAQLVEIRAGRTVAVYQEVHEDASAPLVFFIHGAGARSGQFRDLFPVFRSSYSLLSFDWVGHGQSEKPLQGASFYSAKEMLADVIAIFQRYSQGQEPTSALFVGHSYGTSLATQAYELLKEDVKAMVLIGTCMNVPASARHPIWYLPDSLLEWIRPLMRGPFCSKAYHPCTLRDKVELMDYERTFSDKNAMHVMKHLAWGMEWPTTEQYEAIQCPCLLIGGESDQLTPVEEMEALHQSIEGSEISIIPEAGHFPMMENTVATLRVIQDFLVSHGFPCGPLQGLTRSNENQSISEDAF